MQTESNIGVSGRLPMKQSYGVAYYGWQVPRGLLCVVKACKLFFACCTMVSKEHTWHLVADGNDKLRGVLNASVGIRVDRKSPQSRLRES